MLMIAYKLNSSRPAGCYDLLDTDIVRMVLLVQKHRLLCSRVLLEAGALSLYGCLIWGHSDGKTHKAVVVILDFDTDITRRHTKRRIGRVRYRYIRRCQIGNERCCAGTCVWIVVKHYFRNAIDGRRTTCATGKRRLVGTLHGGVSGTASRSLDQSIMCPEKMASGYDRHEHHEKERGGHSKFHHRNPAFRFFACVTSHKSKKRFHSQMPLVHVAHLGAWL